MSDIFSYQKRMMLLETLISHMKRVGWENCEKDLEKAKIYDIGTKGNSSSTIVIYLMVEDDIGLKLNPHYDDFIELLESDHLNITLCKMRFHSDCSMEFLPAKIKN